MARPLSAQPARTGARAGAGAAGSLSVAVDIAGLLDGGRGSGAGGFGLPAHGSGGGRHVHPHRLPDMAVQILEAAAVHEAVILLLARLAAAAGERLVGDLVDRGSAVGGDADQDLAGLLRIGDPPGGE